MNEREEEDGLRGREVQLDVVFGLVDGLELDEMLVEKYGHTFPKSHQMIDLKGFTVRQKVENLVKSKTKSIVKQCRLKT